MATLSGSFKTLADLKTELTPDLSNVAPVIEMLAESTDILDDIPWMEGNLTTGNRTTQRTSLPTVGFKRVNQGVVPSKATSAQIDEATAHIKTYSEVDKDILDLSPNPQQTRFNEDTAFTQAMQNFLTENLVSGNSAVNPDAFNGFLTRYSQATAATTPYYDSMIDGGGTGTDNMSIILVGWGPRTVSGLYPKSAMGGIRMKDHGEVVQKDGNGLQNTVMLSEFDWWCGLNVADWRYVVRICNIDYSDLRAGGGANLINLLIQALERLPDNSYSESYRPAFYMPRAIRTMLRIQINDKANNNLTTETIAGRKVVAFDSVPCRIIDKLTNSEAQVVFG